MDGDERKPLLLRSPASTSPSRDGNDDLSGDLAPRYSPPRSPSPPTPSPLAKGQPTSPSSTSPPASPRSLSEAMDSDESKPLLLRSPASTLPSRDGLSGNDGLSGDRTRRYSPPRSPSPPTPSPLAKERSTSPSSPSPLAKKAMASDADKPSNGNSTRGAASPLRSLTPSSSADIGNQGHQPQPAPKAEEEAAVDSRSKNHKEEREKASPGEEKEKTAEAPAALSEKEKAAAAPAVLSEKGKAAAAPAALSEKEKAAAAPAALSEKEKAASAHKKKAEIAGCFPSPFPGVSTREEGGCSKGQSASNGADREHLVDIDGWRNLAVLIHRAEELSYRLGGHPTLSGPVAQLSVALHRFAAATDATAARLGLEEAAAALDTVSSNPELDILSASAAKLLALEAAAILTAGRPEQEPGVSVSAAPAAGPVQVSGTSSELYWVAITGSLALLPSLAENFPEGLHFVLALVFAAVFSVASIGAVMSVRGVYKGCARALGVLSFSAFSILVLAFVSFALAQGNIHLIWVGAVIVVVAHVVIFWMSRK